MAKDISLIRIKADTNDYERSIKQAQKTWDDFTKGLGVNVGKLTGVAAAIGAVTGALKVAKDAFFQSESNIDEWGRVVKSSEAAYSTFLNTLNSGNWSNFFTNLSTAVQGARDLYDALDRLGSIKSNNAAAIAIVQQQIAQLRLAKQQGQNVDEQLKKATEQLRNLQNQSINAGMAAGNMAIRNTIKNRVNAENINGINISEGTFIQLAYQLEHEGQAVFDSMKKTFTDLKEKATVETSTSYTNQYGGTSYAKAYIVDINKLTAEEQKQYLIAKAITEGETEIQEGIAMFAQAIQEGTAAAREEFKGNRYALQGAGGSGSGSDTDKIVKETYIPLEGSVDYLSAKLKELQTEFNKTADDSVRGKLYPEIQRIADLIDYIKSGISVTFKNEIGNNLTNKLGIGIDIQKELDNIQVPNEFVQTGIDTQRAWQNAASAISGVGNALNSIQDPASKVLGTIAQAIATMTLSYAQATLHAAELGPFAWIGFATTGLATMLTAISTIESATAGNYANGGIIPGNSFSGDNMMANVNSGELILSKSQQNNIASQLQDNNNRGGYTPSHVSGEQIYLALNAYTKRTGRGEIVTWK